MERMRRPALAGLMMASLALAACQGGLSGMRGPGRPVPEPPPPPVLCPPELRARLLAEPPPPEGLTEEALLAALIGGLGPELGVAFYGWLMVEHRGWARDNAARAARAKGWCDDLAKAG